MEDKLVSVKTYQLAGDGVKIAFFDKDPDELIYEDKQGERKFSGQEIIQEASEQLGSVKTVVLESVPDSHVITLSLAVPSANRPNDARSIPVKTFAVRTTSRTSIIGPPGVEGQILNYELYVLEGNAW